MKKSLIALVALVVLASGCQAIPTDMVPKFRWYWSDEAKQYRADRDAHNPYKHQ